MKPTYSNWSDYLYFLKIAEFRNLQQVAVALGVNSSTVYRRLNALEEKLNIKLFERSRSHQGYDITVAGEQILERLKGIEDLFEAIEEHFVKENVQISGSINIGISDGIGEFWLWQYISAFKDLDPKINIEIKTINRNDRLDQRDIDFAFVIAQKPLEYMESKKIKNVSMHFCATKKLIEQHKSSLKAGEKLEKKIDIIMPADDLKQFNAVRWLYSFRSESAFNFKSDNFLSLYSYCMQDLGATILPDYMIEASSLQKITTSPKEFSVYLWLLTYPHTHLTAASRLFIKFFVSALLSQK